MARKKQFNTRYSPEFKISVILDMRENGLGYNETARKYWGVTTHREASNHRSQIRLWERIYLEEEAGFCIERRGRQIKNVHKDKQQLKYTSVFIICTFVALLLHLIYYNI